MSKKRWRLSRPLWQMMAATPLLAGFFFLAIQLLVLYAEPEAGASFANWSFALQGSIGIAVAFAAAIATLTVAILGLSIVEIQSQRDLESQIESFITQAILL